MNLHDLSVVIDHAQLRRILQVVSFGTSGILILD